MSLRIIKAGILDTVQDAGRFGYRHLGVNNSGAMDVYALQIGNALVGNPPDTPAIEMHFPASSFFFEEPALIAITGADFSPTLNAEPIPVTQPVLVSKFSILQFEKLKKGARAYLSVRRGLDLKPWLGSASTHLKAGAGGFEGRAFQKDDLIKIFPLDTPALQKLGKEEFVILPWKADDQRQNGQAEVMALHGHEWDRLTAASAERFSRQTFMISPHSDRMGYHLQADPLAMMRREEIISAGVGFGTVQLLPDGKLIVLMADHQTTGGYPRVAHVINAHHGRLAQLKPGDTVQFRFTDQATAEELLVKQQQHLHQLQFSCSLRLEEYLR